MDQLQQDREVKWLEKEAEKDLLEQKMRHMWRGCFQDPKHYEDFYFLNVYKKNTVCYKKEDEEVVGMLHLNPYDCYVNEKRQILHYIVGVATHPEYRRQGIMRRLLKAALEELWQRKEPISYLMPANTAYYEPFSFVSVQKEQKRILSLDMQMETAEDRNITFVPYEEIEEKLADFKELNSWLQQHSIVPIRSEEYFKLLYEEKKCQNGNVIFLFENNRLQGYFTFARVGEQLYMEQFVAKQIPFEVVGRFFKGAERITWMQSFPYMVRIVHLGACLEIFQNRLKNVFQGKVYVQITDSLLEQNNRCYQMFWSQGGCSLQELDVFTFSGIANANNSLVISVEELAVALFCETENTTFFAEVV